MSTDAAMPFTPADSAFMAEAIRLASKGLYSTMPNPRVGCVLVNNEVIVGSGWHQFAGEAHAEVNAIASAGDKARGATAYLTLEPCNFVGRTGACVDALQAAGIARVVSAMDDPNPLVAGKGHAALRATGIEVTVGLMAGEAAALNPGFIKRMEQGLPYVRCKMAASLDGRAAMASGESQWITGPAARHQVQLMRARSCAIVTGVGTIIKDNPQLTIREAEFGGPVQRQPALVITDSDLRLPLDSKVLGKVHLSQRQVIIACVEGVDAARKQALLNKGVEIIVLAKASLTPRRAVDLTQLLGALAEREFNEVLLESGPVLAGSFINEKQVDELQLFVAPKLMGATAMPVFGLQFEQMQEAVALTIGDVKAVGRDWLFTCLFNNE